MGQPDDPSATWAELLAGWAIPAELVAAAGESPYFFDPEVFVEAADEALAAPEDTPTDAVARDALPAGGTVLDVGVGAGAASLRLAGQASLLVGVDTNSALLEAFAARAANAGVGAVTVEGRWPDVAATVPTADVAVCAHVVYNAPDLAAFARALTGHARRRVVLEATAAHPMAWMAPYWRALHGLAQPDRPTADDAVAVLEALGVTVGRRRWRRPLQMIGEGGPHRLARLARRLCLSPSRLGELQAVLAAEPPPRVRDVVTLWWDVALG